MHAHSLKNLALKWKETSDTYTKLWSYTRKIKRLGVNSLMQTFAGYPIVTRRRSTSVRRLCNVGGVLQTLKQRRVSTGLAVNDKGR